MAKSAAQQFREEFMAYEKEHRADHKEIKSQLRSLSKQVQKVDDDVNDGLKSDVAFIKGVMDGHLGTPSRKTITVRRLAEAAGATLIVIAVIGGIAAVILGRLSAEDFANILRAIVGN